MAETINIAKMAEILSKKKYFPSSFGNKSALGIAIGLVKNQELHDANTHPSDVVFYYDEPYRATRTYIQCDLKSYSRGSIKPQNIKNAIEALARSVACANVSEEWRNLYIHDNVTPEICGLLFVYNHDGEYDKNFRNGKRFEMRKPRHP